ncbi:MAG: threonylcarbamoyl-AMP synthase [Candidatus Marinimicrobia bacterium]|nr:threonylcarbamoyl-AMP synthase [Candidatus Neomarinimicrobiota bacterium]|tara:strand:+ start:2499 stop:3086 length:588 start_codon:yes stop_codon:yes gene_type:complete
MKNKVTQRVNSNSKKSILNAAEVILNGGIIVYPTDTLYGFGVDANNISAINKLNKLKGREGPISVVMQDINTIISCAKIDDVEAEIIRKNLIGYTTIILPVKSGTVYKSIMGEGETLGIRLPDHSFATNLCKLIDGPITTTSVNRSGEIPLNDPNEIFKVFNGEFDLLIDDGKINHTKGSTIYKLENYKLNTIRK